MRISSKRRIGFGILAGVVALSGLSVPVLNSVADPVPTSAPVLGAAPATGATDTATSLPTSVTSAVPTVTATSESTDTGTPEVTATQASESTPTGPVATGQTTTRALPGESPNDGALSVVISGKGIQSTLLPATQTVIQACDGTSEGGTVTATVKDPDGNLVQGATVEFTITDQDPQMVTSGPDGTATVKVFSVSQKQFAWSVDVEASLVQPDSYQFPGPGAQVFFHKAPGCVPTPASIQMTIPNSGEPGAGLSGTITLKDADSNPIVGADLSKLTLIPSSPNVIISQVSDYRDGRYLFTMSSEVEGDYTLIATYDDTISTASTSFEIVHVPGAVVAPPAVAENVINVASLAPGRGQLAVVQDTSDSRSFTARVGIDTSYYKSAEGLVVDFSVSGDATFDAGLTSASVALGDIVDGIGDASVGLDVHPYAGTPIVFTVSASVTQDGKKTTMRSSPTTVSIGGPQECKTSSTVGNKMAASTETQPVADGAQTWTATYTLTTLLQPNGACVPPTYSADQFVVQVFDANGVPTSNVVVGTVTKVSDSTFTVAFTSKVPGTYTVKTLWVAMGPAVNSITFSPVTVPTVKSGLSIPPTTVPTASAEPTPVMNGLAAPPSPSTVEIKPMSVQGTPTSESGTPPVPVSEQDASTAPTRASGSTTAATTPVESNTAATGLTAPSSRSTSPSVSTSLSDEPTTQPGTPSAPASEQGVSVAATGENVPTSTSSSKSAPTVETTSEPMIEPAVEGTLSVAQATDGSQSYQARVGITDPYRNPLPGLQVTFSVAGDATFGAGLATATVLTDDQGLAEVDVVPVPYTGTPLTFTVSTTVTYQGEAIPLRSSPATVTIGGPECTDTPTLSSTVAASGGGQPVADGVQAWTATYTLSSSCVSQSYSADQFDVRVFDASGSPSTNVVVGTVTKVSDTTFRVSFTSKVAGSYTVKTSWVAIGPAVDTISFSPVTAPALPGVQVTVPSAVSASTTVSPVPGALTTASSTSAGPVAVVTTPTTVPTGPSAPTTASSTSTGPTAALATATTPTTVLSTPTAAPSAATEPANLPTPLAVAAPEPPALPMTTAVTPGSAPVPPGQSVSVPATGENENPTGAPDSPQVPVPVAGSVVPPVHSASGAGGQPTSGTTVQPMSGTAVQLPSVAAVPTPAPSATAASIELSSTTLSPGQSVVVTGHNWVPGEQVTITVHSTPIQFPPVMVNPDGSLPSMTVAVPADFDPGTHTLTAVGSQSGTVTVSFQVLAVGQVPTGVVPTGVVPGGSSPAGSMSGQGQSASTGGQAAPGVGLGWLVGVAFVAAGLAVAVVRRRKA